MSHCGCEHTSLHFSSEDGVALPLMWELLAGARAWAGVREG